MPVPLKQAILRYTRYNRRGPFGLVERATRRVCLGRWERAGCHGPPPAAFKHATIVEYGRRAGASTLIETGTFLGDTIDAVLPNFRRVITIELDESLAEAARRRFRTRPQVTVLHGNSSDLVPGVMAELQAPAIFWLDAHFSGFPTAMSETETPLIGELSTILSHPLPHTVLVDDCRLLGTRGYPSSAEIAQLAVAHGRTWTIEYDIGRIVPR
jgi:hypothetical protein